MCIIGNINYYLILYLSTLIKGAILVDIFVYFFYFSIFIRILMKQALLTNFEDEKAIWLGRDHDKFHLIDLFLIKAIIDR